MAINKKEFSDRMAEIGGITKKSALQATELFIEAVKEYLSEGERVMLSGFGSFEMRKVKARNGINPQTGGGCIIPGHKRVYFHPSDDLAARILKMGEEMDTYEE